MALSLASTFKLNSGYEMPILGFGVYQNHITKDSVVEALKVGYRNIDSAQMYENETEVGEAVAESGLPRESVFVTTKIHSDDNSNYETAAKAIDTSLARLKFSYIDLFLVHDPFAGKERRLEMYKAVLDAKKAGKVRTVGVSNYGLKHLEEIKAAGLETPAVNQIEVHPFCQQRPIVEYCKSNNIIVQAYCPIARGQFDNPIIQTLAKKHNRDPAHILLRWSLQKGLSPLPKSATPARIKSNTNLYDFELTSEDIVQLDTLDKGKDGAISWNPVEAP